MIADTSRPTIHWISPISPAQTDIAHYSGRILPALTKLANVVLWTDTAHWDPALERLCQVRCIDPDAALPHDLKRAAYTPNSPEAIFINIGNSWVFHAGLLRLARRLPAIVVLHDLAIQELLLEAVKHGLFGRTSYLSEMKLWYGSRGAEAGLERLNSSITSATFSSEMPGFELCLNRAHSVLTHTQAADAAVRSRTQLPSHCIELPFAAGTKPSFQRLRFGPLRLLQFGFIGPNRRLEQVLETLAGMGADFGFIFDIMGQVWNPELIRKRINDLGLQNRVKLHGYVSEPVLDAALMQAHLVLNLRHPTMHEASGSQLRIWNAGAAAAVSNDGWYRQLPDDTVFKIDLSDEKNQLQTLFHRLASDRSISVPVGRAGHARLLQIHRPEQYAQALVKITQEAGKEARIGLQRRAIQRLWDNGPKTQIGIKRANTAIGLE